MDPNASTTIINQVSALEVVSIVSSVVSVIIGIFAIWLSVVFYKLSNSVSEETKEASKGIMASVDRLESLFDRLYTDTFSMMRDTVSDMRKHMWPEKDQSANDLIKIEEKADIKIQELKSQITSELASIMHHVGKTDHKLDGIETRFTQLIDRAIQQTRRVESETQEEISMADVLNQVMKILERYGEMPVRDISAHPTIRRRFPRRIVEEALSILVRDNVVRIDGPLEKLSTKVGLIPRDK